MHDWQRARNEDQKEARIQEILNGARREFAEKQYEEITLGSIAQSLSMGRSNIYRYFSSKEEVFLALVASEFESWSQDMRHHFSPGMSPENFAQVWIDHVLNRPMLLKLMPYMSTSIERNVSEEALRLFKKRLSMHMSSAQKGIHRLFPGISEFQARIFVNAQMGLLAGLYPLSYWEGLPAKLLALDEFESLRVDFPSAASTAISAMLRGMISKPEGSSEFTEPL